MRQSDAQLTIPNAYYRVSLKALIFDDQDRVLVVQTADGMWELPGGGWEHGETMQHCVRREILEEIGVGVKDIDFNTMYPYSSKGRTGHWRLKLAVRVAVDSKTFDTSGNPDILQTQFVSAQELARLSMVDAEAGIKAHIARIWS